MDKRLLDRIGHLKEEVDEGKRIQKRDKAILTALINELGLNYHAQLYPEQTIVTFEKKTSKGKTPA